MKTFNSFHIEELEVKFKNLSGNISVLRENKLSRVNISKKRDNTPVSIELWLFWLNAGIKYDLNFDQ